MASRRASPSFSRGADDRPRVHLARTREGWRWSAGPCSAFSPPHATIGRAVEAALAGSGAGEALRKGAVLIVEPAETAAPFLAATLQGERR